MKDGIYVEFFLMQDGARLRLNDMPLEELIEKILQDQLDAIDIAFGDMSGE